MKGFFSIIFFLFTALCVQAQGKRKAKEIIQANELSAKDSLMLKQWFFAGLREKTIQNYQLAADMFKRVIDVDPVNDAAFYELSNIYNIIDQKDKAEQYIKKAVGIKPQNRWYWLLLADIYREKNNVAELLPVINQLIKIEPDNEDFYFDKANVLLFQNKVSDANSVYNEIEKKFGPSEDLITARQQVLLQQGKPEKAIAELEKQIQQNPSDLKYYFYLSELYLKENQKQKALETLQQAKKQEPGNGAIRLSIADVYRSMGKNDDAFIELKAAFSDQNLSVDQKVRIVLSLFPSFADIKARSQADELASILSVTHPDDPKAHAVYGDVLFQEQKFEEAKAAYRKALSLNDQVYLIWEQLVRIEISEGNFAEAVKDGEAALAIFPNQAPLYLYTGIALGQLQKHEKAISYLKNAATLQTEDKTSLAQIYAALGDSYNALKRFKDSDLAYEKALEYNPADSYTLNNYAYYLSLRGENLTKAEQMSRRSIELEPSNSSFEDTFAWILFKLKKYNEARKWMEKALSNDENNGTQLEHYGDILFHLGEVEEAVVQWKKAREQGIKTETIDKKINEKKYFE